MTSGLDASLSASLERLIAAAPGKVTITSGRRTAAQQQALYDAYRAGKGNLAARPGTSRHETGSAVDLHFDSPATAKWVHDNAARFGVSFPVAGEPWHAELAGGTKVAAVKKAAPTAKPSPARTASDYGYAQAFFNSDKSLKALLNKAIAGDWTADKFQAELMNTSWYRTHSEAQRRWIALNTADHTSARRQVEIKMHEIDELARKMGATMTGLEVHDLAVNALYKGLTNTEVRSLVGAQVEAKKGEYGGAASETQLNLKTEAGRYGVTLSQGQQDRWITDLAKGLKTDADFQTWVREQSKLLYPTLGSAIDKGVTLADIAGNYTSRLSQLLELDPTSVDFTKDPLVQQALQYRDPAGKNDGQPMPLYAFEKLVKSDPRWLNTNNARGQFMSVGAKILRDMGLAS